MMKVNQASGFVTLTVTLMLTLAGSYLFFQSVDSAQYTVMRYQNTLSAKKNHWAAEGGLACAYGVNKTTAGTPMSRDYSLCNGLVFDGSADASRLQVAVTPIEITPDALYTLSSEAKEVHGRGKRVVMRDIQLTGGAPMPGIFKTSSKLRLTGSFDFLPNKNTNKVGEHECVSLIVKNKSDFIHTDSVIGSKLIVRDRDGYRQSQLPSGVKLSEVNNSAVDSRLSFECKNGYQTFQQVGAENIAFAKDVIEDPDMDMFRDFFGQPRENWQTVRDGKFPAQGIINKDQPEQMVTDCAQQIIDRYAAGVSKIWVDGSCYLSRENIDTSHSAPFNFGDPSSNPTEQKPVMVIVRDGIVFSPADFTFSGLFYQFNTGDRSNEHLSQDMVQACIDSNSCGKGDLSQQEPYKEWGFFVKGSMNVYGGLAVDMEGLGFNVQGAMIATYDSSKWEGLLPTPSGGVVNWKQGTWRDF
ncbi:hypothetical protein [Photobacterium sp. TY1-4]|uniref:hypothetical protein n=1 Tax=Photobacterium sp. TY1-4 TaxID=2899122 RepID=UPI0021C1013B|nr:hypothetical protein [Photobacterium sp. TY1-4]UXI00754.1 hypothetical protein NH461_13225 [Photobacterium sp. TY1-4]